MAEKYLDKAGVQVLWNKIKNALNGKANSTHLHSIGSITDLNKGKANGVASLGPDGKVPTSQLPVSSGGEGFTYAPFEAYITGGEDTEIDFSDTIYFKLYFYATSTPMYETHELTIYAYQDLKGEFSELMRVSNFTKENNDTVLAQLEKLNSDGAGLYCSINSNNKVLEYPHRFKKIKVSYSSGSSQGVYVKGFIFK